MKDSKNDTEHIDSGVRTVPESISAKTLADMDATVANFKANMVSGPIDLIDFD